jgi:hypothetical protein
MNIPDDADGDAMRRVIADGADLTRPMRVDFQIDCPDRASAQAIAAKVPPAEFAVSVYEDSESGTVKCECSRDMLLEYSGLIRVQTQLAELVRPFGGRCGAWGTFGNSQTAEPGASGNSRSAV